MRRPQSIRGSVWNMGGRKRRRQKPIGGLLPLAAVTKPLLGTVGGEVMKKIFGGRRRCKRVRYV